MAANIRRLDGLDDGRPQIHMSGPGIRPIQVDPAVAALEGSAVRLPAHPDLQEGTQILARQLLLGEGLAQALVDTDGQWSGG